MYKQNNKKWNKNGFPICQTKKKHFHVKLDFQSEDQHARGRWLIDATEHYKDNKRLHTLLYNIIVDKKIDSGPMLTCFVQYSNRRSNIQKEDSIDIVT